MNDAATRVKGAPIGRTLRAILLAASVLALSVVSALLTGSGGSAVTGWVEGLSSRFSTGLSGIGQLLSLGYAFGAGAVSAVNPCGFAMLPVYLGLYLGTLPRAGAERENRAVPQSLGRALLVGTSVTAGFLALFGIVGLLIGAGAHEVSRFFPEIGLIVGLLLIAGGGWLVSGRTLYASFGERAASRVRGVQRVDLRGYFAFGVAYGTASLSCTLPIFLTVIAGGLTANSIVGAALQFLLYGLGMGTVVLALTVSMALFQGTLVGFLRGAVRYVESIAVILLFVSGAYLVYYWLTIGGLSASQ